MSSMNPWQLKKHLEELKEKEFLEKGRKTKTLKDNFVIMEEEFKIGEATVGTVIGELAMMDPKATRALSGMAKTDCIFLLLNHDSFDILVKEKQKKESEALTHFIFDSIPKMREQFQFKKVVKNVKILFP